MLPLHLGTSFVRFFSCTQVTKICSVVLYRFMQQVAVSLLSSGELLKLCLLFLKTGSGYGTPQLHPERAGGP